MDNYLFVGPGVNNFEANGKKWTQELKNIDDKYHFYSTCMIGDDPRKPLKQKFTFTDHVEVFSGVFNFNENEVRELLRWLEDNCSMWSINYQKYTFTRDPRWGFSINRFEEKYDENVTEITYIFDIFFIEEDEAMGFKLRWL